MAVWYQKPIRGIRMPRLPSSSRSSSEMGSPIWTAFRPGDGVHRADWPVGQLVHPVHYVDGSHSREPWGIHDLVLSVLAHPTSPGQRHPGWLAHAPHRPRTGSGSAARDQVGCHASRSMRPRICPKSRCVKWLSASCRTKYRACRMRRPPVLNSRYWRFVRDQLSIARGGRAGVGDCRGCTRSRPKATALHWPGSGDRRGGSSGWPLSPP
jgi:hypothetical protein